MKQTWQNFETVLAKLRNNRGKIYETDPGKFMKQPWEIMKHTWQSYETVLANYETVLANMICFKICQDHLIS